MINQTPQHRLLARLVVASATATLAFGGCTDSDEGTQPAPDVTTFEQGDFSDIPLPPRSEAVGERTEQQGVVSRSYAARNTTPEAIMDFYAREFGADTVVEPPSEIGVNTFRGRWLVGDRQLTVSATRADTIEGVERFNEEVEVVTQFSLSLAPGPGAP